MPLSERCSLSVADRRRSLGIPLSERCSLPVVDRRRVPFLLAQERNQRKARGASPLRPPRRLRLACGQSQRRPATDQWAGVQHPASRRTAGAMPLPVSLRNRTGSSHRGDAAAFISLACPTGRRKTARLRRARAQSARMPGTGVVFRRGFWRAIRLRSLGAPAT